MSQKIFTFREPRTQTLEVYSESGELLGVKKDHIDPIATLEERAVEVELPNGQKVFVDPKNSLPEHRWEYSTEMAMKICDELLEGKYLSSVCDGTLFPPFKTVMRWKRNHAEFERMYMEAMEDRAEYFGDEMRKLADTTNQDNSSARSVQISAYKHLAAVDNPKRFQPKAAGQSVLPSTATVVIVTGIARPGDMGYVEVQQTQMPASLPEGSEDEN